MIDVRITRSYESFYGELEKVFPRSCWFEETGKEGKVHIHGCIDGVTAQAIRTKLRMSFDLHGNVDFKVSEIRTENYFAYISKDGDCKYNGLHIDFSEYKWVEPKKLDTVGKIFEKAEIGCGLRYYIEWCINYLVDNDRLVNKRLVELYVSTYMCRTDSGYKNGLVSKLLFEMDR